MCPKRIGGRAVRAEVGRTAARCYGGARSGAPGTIGYSLPAVPGAGYCLKVRRHALPAVEASGATGRLPAALAPGSSLRAFPPRAGLPRAGLEPRDLQVPTPRYRQLGKTRTEADRTCGRPGATAVRFGPAGRQPLRPAAPAHRPGNPGTSS